MQKIQAEVRVVLTFVVAASAFVIGLVDDQTIRMILGALVAGLGAVGIVPPHIPTTTSIPDEEPVNVLREE